MNRLLRRRGYDELSQLLTDAPKHRLLASRSVFVATTTLSALPSHHHAICERTTQ